MFAPSVKAETAHWTCTALCTRRDAMTLPRRQFLRLAAGAAAIPALPRFARAQPYPSRPVRIIIGGTGATDVMARLLGQWLSERLGQPFVIESRPGAGGNLAAEMVVRASADGHTLLMLANSSAINATLYDKLSFNLVRDIAPVASLIRQPHVLLVNSDFPAKAVPDLIAHAKANPGKINMASPGIGTGPHMAGELFKLMSGVDIVHVPYRGAPQALTDLLGGQVQMMFPAPAAVAELIREGSVRALAVGTATRWEALPDIPTMDHYLRGYEASTWFGLGAPRNTRAEIIDTLNREINAGLADPTIKKRIGDLGGGIFTTSPAEFGKFVADETEKWGKVIRAAKISI
jgi:tripartite-type tricarboxylate transporter receptor subunit TctC